ncbi:MAG: hypothetical protein M3Y27_13295 [Acidobacteriota bacterium]|nr:hypothetical protein [Acidobacteriota bacterium]
MVVVTKLFAAQAGAGAAVPGGEDVAALEAYFGFCAGVEIILRHGGIPFPLKWGKVFNLLGLALDFFGLDVERPGLKAKARRVAGLGEIAMDEEKEVAFGRQF